MAKCPLAEVIRDIDQLGSNPPRCWEQCSEAWEAAIKEGKSDHDVFVDDEADDCPHPAVESTGQSIVRIGESALRDLVLHEFCTSCGEEVQSTTFRFTCSHETE